MGEAPVDPAALRDAVAIAARIADDEAAADDARRRYLTVRLPVIESEAEFAQLAAPGEILHATRRYALLERTSVGEAPTRPETGTLYLSSQRLLHLGRSATGVPLGDIQEMAVALERLLLVHLQDGTHLAIDTDQPRMLRVQVAAALAATRVGGGEAPTIAAGGQPATQPVG